LSKPQFGNYLYEVGTRDPRCSVCVRWIVEGLQIAGTTDERLGCR